jgi:ABC-type oligopeptide transport system substrate-binding subunit
LAQDWSTYLTSREDLDFDVARAGWILDSNNVLNYLEALIAHTGYSDATVVDLVADAQSALDAHVVALKALHDHILGVMVVLPLYYY